MIDYILEQVGMAVRGRDLLTATIDCTWQVCIFKARKEGGLQFTWHQLLLAAFQKKKKETAFDSCHNQLLNFYRVE